MTSPVDNRSRGLALALLLGVLAVGYFVLVHPWWTLPMLEADQRIHDLRERELRMRMQVRQAPAVRQQWQAAVDQQAQRPGFLPEASVELATAGLVQRLEAAVRQASPGNRSCGIRNQSPLSVPAKERYPRVVVQVRLSCGTPELMALLHALESGSPRLFVDNLNILSTRQGYLTQPTGSGGLDVSFDLYGYLQPQAGTPAPAAGGGHAR